MYSSGCACVVWHVLCYGVELGWGQAESVGLHASSRRGVREGTARSPGARHAGGQVYPGPQRISGAHLVHCHPLPHICAQVWVYGNSFKNSLVAFVVPSPALKVGGACACMLHMLGGACRQGA